MLRYRYRPAAIQPEMVEGKVNASLSVMKKEKPKQEDLYANMFESTWEDPIFLATSTQVKRSEVMIVSDEAAFRTKSQPCVAERIVQQKQWAQEQLEKAKIQQQREAMKLKQALMLKNIQDGVGTDESVMDELEKMEEEVKEIDELDQQDLHDELMSNTKIDYAEQIMQIKERKLTTSRNTVDYHNYFPLKTRRWMAFRLWMGWGTNYGKRREVTEILPWLVLGNRETAMNLQELLRLNITHILNMSGDSPNSFPQHFVYHKINVRDSVEADIGKHFQAIVKFIKRVEDCKGRIFVHCTAGASRAPTAILAFLIYHRDVTLVDAYKYMLALRPVVKPNTHFLFQLAMLEVQLSNECSVYFHPDWRFFEFNTFRAEEIPARATNGLFNTAVKLLAPVELSVDLLKDVNEDENDEDKFDI